MIPCTGTGISIYCQDTLWSSGRSSFSGRTGAGSKYRRRPGAIMPPLQGILWCNTGITPVPQYIQCGSVRRHRILDDGGDADGGGREGTWCVGAGPCGIFLHRRRTSRIAPSRKVAEVVWRPHRPLQKGQNMNGREEDSENELSALTHTWRHVRGRVWETDDRGQSIISVAAGETDTVNIMRCGDIRGVAAGTPQN